MNKPDINKLESNLKSVIESMGLDLKDPNLKDTPRRLAKMYINELFRGVYEELPEFATFPKEGNNFIYTKVPFKSTCAHHFQPIKGIAHIMVDYTEAKEVLGLSKFNRIVEHFAARPTLQENLTNSIASYLTELLNVKEVYVGVEATHHCVTDRGVCAAFSNTFTEVSYGDSIFNNRCTIKLQRGA